jgi:hypothetical protein
VPLRLGGEGRGPLRGLAAPRGEQHTVDVEALVVGEHLGEVRLDAHRAPEPQAVDLEGDRHRSRGVHERQLGARQQPLVVAGDQLTGVRYHVHAVVRPVRRGQRVHGPEHRPQPELGGEAGDRRELCPQDLPVGPVPVRRADLGRPGDRYDPLVRGTGGALGKVNDPRAGPAGLPHELAHVAAAAPQPIAVAGVFAHDDLRRGQPHWGHFRHDVSLLHGTDVPEGRGVRFAGLRRARTHTALEVPVGGHPAFVHVSATASPASLSETDGLR